MAVSCTPADLAAASKCLCGIASPADRQRVMIYLLQHIAGLDNLTPAELVARAKCLCGIPENRLKAVEVALLCAATGGVPPCPPCPPGGNCTYQDMQVAWTPTNLKLGELIGFSAFAGLPSITSITFEAATSIGQFDIESCADLTSLSWPNLVSCDPLNIQGGGLYAVSNPALTSLSAPLLQIAAVIGIRDDNALTSLSFPALTTIVGQFDVENCTALTSISFPNFLPSNAADIRASGCALTSATINHILARGIASAGFVTGQVNIDGQTPPAPPSGQGIADKAALILRGVTVNTD